MLVYNTFVYLGIESSFTLKTASWFGFFLNYGSAVSAFSEVHSPCTNFALPFELMNHLEIYNLNKVERVE